MQSQRKLEMRSHRSPQAIEEEAHSPSYLNNLDRLLQQQQPGEILGSSTLKYTTYREPWKQKRQIILQSPTTVITGTTLTWVEEPESMNEQTYDQVIEQLRNQNMVKMMQIVIESKMCLEWIVTSISTAIVYLQRLSCIVQPQMMLLPTIGKPDQG